MTHFFTPEEANKALENLKRTLRSIVELKKLIDASSGRDRSEHINALGIQITKLETLGVELKDMDSGLVDFPAIRFGEEVSLCWKLGEPQVLYWHRASEGFRGRKPLKPEAIEAL